MIKNICDFLELKFYINSNCNALHIMLYLTK